MENPDPNNKSTVNRLRQGGGTDGSESGGILGRARSASLSLMNANPQLGMWQATGLAIAQAPNLTELRDPEAGGANIEFNAQGHSIRTAIEEPDGELALVKSMTRRPTIVELPSVTEEEGIKQSADQPAHVHHHRTMREVGHDMRVRRRALKDKHKAQCKERWGPTMFNGLKA